jgi:outer membrane protein
MNVKTCVPNVVLALVLLVAAGRDVLGQQPPSEQGQPSLADVPLKIAVIDLDIIRRDAAVVRDIRQQLGRYRARFQADIQKEEEEVRNADQELARQRAILAPETFAEARRKFKQRLAEAQRMVQQRKQALDKSRSEAMGEVNRNLNQVVADIARENSLTFILRRGQTVLWPKSLDITAKVLEQLNAKLPSLNVPEPEPPKPDQ